MCIRRTPRPTRRRKYVGGRNGHVGAEFSDTDIYQLVIVSPYIVRTLVLVDMSSVATEDCPQIGASMGRRRGFAGLLGSVYSDRVIEALE